MWFCHATISSKRFIKGHVMRPTSYIHIWMRWKFPIVSLRPHASRRLMTRSSTLKDVIDHHKDWNLIFISKKAMCVINAELLAELATRTNWWIYQVPTHLTLLNVASFFSFNLTTFLLFFSSLGTMGRHLFLDTAMIANGSVLSCFWVVRAMVCYRIHQEVP